MTKIKIKCRRSAVGVYDCCVSIKKPQHIIDSGLFNPLNDRVSFDHCLANELFNLWDKGIVTTGCCCGRHKGEPLDNSRAYIGVVFSDIQKMKDLGYKVHYNPNRPEDEDSFTPKTFENDSCS